MRNSRPACRRPPLPVNSKLKDVPWAAKTRERLQTDKAFLIAKPMRKAAWTKRFAANGPPRPLPPIPRRSRFVQASVGSPMLVDSTVRLFRGGKATISANLAGIFDGLGSRAENWHARMEKLRKGRLYGRFFDLNRFK